MKFFKFDLNYRTKYGNIVPVKKNIFILRNKDMKRTLSYVLAFIMLVSVCLTAVSCGNKSRYNYDLDDYIVLPEYKGLEARANAIEVTDDTIRAIVDSVVDSYSRKIEITDRAADVGDVATVSYSGYTEGVSEDYITRENVELTIGFGRMPEEFESALIGMMPGDIKQIYITFPEDFAEYPDYAGKTASLTLRLDLICELEAPVYNDDFARAYLNHASVEEYEAYVRETLTESRKKAYNELVLNQIWQGIVDGTEVKKYPDAEVKRYYNELIDSVKIYVDSLGLDYAAFIEKNFEMTEDEFHAYALESAQETVKEEMICNAIARAEKIKLTNDEYTSRATVYATELYKFGSLAEFEEEFSRDKIEELILGDLVKEFVVDNANVTINEN